MSNAPVWKQYQEDVATFFRELGFQAETDVSLQGARTKHDVDVAVRSHLAGFPLLWVIECKFWNTAVPKLHVLGLRQIVTDVGADRGIVLCESGFQKGAIEAATRTDVHLLSFGALKESTRSELAEQRLRSLYARYCIAKKQYREVGSWVGIPYGLGSHPGSHKYCASTILYFAAEAFEKSLRGDFPMKDLHIGLYRVSLTNSEDAVSFLDPLLGSLEARLASCFGDAANWPRDPDEAYDRMPPG
jgi:restriction system protein